jgi:serine/threonine-protein kinase RIO1
MVSSAERFRVMHQDPAFAAARDQRGRERFKGRHQELQNLSNAARRGVHVPPELEEKWKALKRKRVSNEEAAAMLGIKRKRAPRWRKGSSIGKI